MKYVSAIIVCLGFLVSFNTSIETASASEAVSFSDSSNYQHHHDVYYHLNHWQSRYFNDHNQLHNFMNALRNLGCQVHEQGNSVHYTCPQERYRHFHDHNSAYNFMYQMRAIGFHAHMH